MRHLIDPTDLTTAEVDVIINRALDIINNKEMYAEACHGKKLATLFYEPSTRTRLSFTAAMMELGGNVLGFSDAASSSVSKGETVADTVRVIGCFADIIAMRHSKEGAPLVASHYSEVPIINAGDGANQHPTQTMLDLYSIKKTQGKLTDLTISMVGDLKYGRTVHSLLMAMRYFNPRYNFVSPPELRIPEQYRAFCKENGIEYHEYEDMNRILNESDILYMTRVQQERFTDPVEYEKVRNTYSLHNAMLEGTKDNLRILHPLPRITEIAEDVDCNPKAYYFEQAKNGVYARQAVICSILGLV